MINASEFFKERLRKMTSRGVGICVICFIGLCGATDRARAGEFLSLRDLKEMCDSISPIRKARCEGTILGLFDGLGVKASLSPGGAAGPINQTLFCTPRNAGSKQIIEVARRGVRTQPEILHLSARDGFIQIMRGAFPCQNTAGVFPAPYRTQKTVPPFPKSPMAPSRSRAPALPGPETVPSSFQPVIINGNEEGDENFSLRGDER